MLLAVLAAGFALLSGYLEPMRQALTEVPRGRPPTSMIAALEMAIHNFVDDGPPTDSAG